MSRKIVFQVVFLSVLSVASAFAASDSIVASGGDLRISDIGSGLVFPDGSVQYSATPTAESGVVSGGVQVNQISIGAGESKDIATLSMNLVGGKRILALPMISGITWPPAPEAYGGHNHSLHVSIVWNILAGSSRTVIASVQQSAEQNIIQLQGAGGPTPAGVNSIVLQAVNNSYWSLDDSPYGTTPTGTNSFSAMLSAMEL
jgi:hypothetical protein